MNGQRRILILRPEPGNSETIARLVENGLVATSLPLFDVQPLAWAAPPSSGFDAILLSSANAVRMAGDALMHYQNLPALCVGPATAKAAALAGLQVAHVGDGGVAALVKSAPGRLLWLCGAPRSDLPVEDAMRVRACPVYQSVARDIPPGFVDAPAIVLIHSVRAAQRFARLVQDRKAITIIAISAAVASAAGEEWESVSISPQPDDAEMVAIAAELCQKHR